MTVERLRDIVVAQLPELAGARQDLAEAPALFHAYRPADPGL